MCEIEHDELVIPGDFFYGNIPIEWFSAALQLPRCGFKLALLIWHYYSMRHAPVRVSMVKCRMIGMGRRARNTALSSMVEAGLVKVDGSDNKAPVVRILKRGGRPAQCK